MSEQRRALYILDCTGPAPKIVKSFPADGLNWLQREQLEARIRAENAIDDETVFLRDSENDR